MSRYTTTMNEYLNSEFDRMGLNEFVHDGLLVFDNDDFQFMQKILNYDEDTENIMNQKIFKGFSLSDKDVDREFKKTFLHRFMDREIGRQTIEAFSHQVLYVTLTHKEYIENVFSGELIKFLQNHVITNTEDIGNAIAKEVQNQNSTQNTTTEDHQKYKGNDVTNSTGETHDDTKTHSNGKTTGKETNENTGTSKHREANATLPQSQQNLNLNSDTMSYADNQTNSNDKTTSNTTSNTEGTSTDDSTGSTDGTSKSNSKTDSTSTTDNNGKGLTTSESDLNRRNDEDTKANHKGIVVTYDLKNLEQMFEMKEKIFEVFEKKCFLHIW